MAKFDPSQYGTARKAAFDPAAFGTARATAPAASNPRPVMDDAKETFDISQATGLPINTVRPNRQVLDAEISRLYSSQKIVSDRGKVNPSGQMEAWEPTVWDRITGYFYQPVMPGRTMGRSDQPFRTGGKLLTVGATSVLSGLSFNTLDVMAAKSTDEATMHEAVAKVLGIELKPGEKKLANALQYAGGLRTAGTLIRPIVSKLPARAAYRYLIGGAAQFATRESAEQAVERITIDDPIEFTEINREAAFGLLFGGVEAGLARASRYFRFKDFIKARPEFRDATKFPPKLIKTMFEAGDAVQGGMSQANVLKVYGNDIDQFLLRMNQHFGQAAPAIPKLLGASAAPAEAVARSEDLVKRNMMKRYGQGIETAKAAGDAEAAAAMQLMQAEEIANIEAEADAGADAAQTFHDVMKFAEEGAAEIDAERAAMEVTKPFKMNRDADSDLYGWHGEINGQPVHLFRDTEQFGYSVWYHQTPEGAIDVGSTKKDAIEAVQAKMAREMKAGLATEAATPPEQATEPPATPEVPQEPAQPPGDLATRPPGEITEPPRDVVVSSRPTELATADQPPVEEGTTVEVFDSPIPIVSKALKAARKARPKTEAEQKKTRKQRVAAASSALEDKLGKEGTVAEQEIFKSSGLLKGPLANYDQVFEPIRGEVNAANPNAIDDMFRDIGSRKGMQYFNRQNTARAFQKLLDGQSLTYREADLIEDFFGTELGADAKARIGQDPLASKLVTIWRAGLLTGVKTSGLNVTANLSHGITETAKDIPAVAMDNILSLFTGEHKIGLTVGGYPSGLIEGAVKGWEYLKTGVDERIGIEEKLDYHQINMGTSKFAKGIQTYEEVVFHLLGAEDQPFYYGAKARSLASQAIGQSKNIRVDGKKLKGQDRKAAIENLFRNPTDEMIEQAVYDAEVAVFLNRTVVGDYARAIQRAGVIGEFVVPFSRTPGAVATQVVNYTPVGMGAEAVRAFKDIRDPKKSFDQTRFSHAFGRSAIGVAGLAAGAGLYKAGKMILDRPASEKERELQSSEGKKPNAILVGNKWRSPTALGPIGTVLLIGGHIQKALDEDEGAIGSGVAGAAGGLKSFSEQSFVTGANQALQAIADPKRGFKTYFSNFAGSWVPTLVADIARANDTVERRAVTAAEKVKNRIPGARKSLEPKVDAYGQDVPRYGGNILEVMADPTRPAIVRSDIVVDEMRRLWDAGIQVSPTLLGDKEGFEVLTPEENTGLLRRAGDLTHTALTTVIQHEAGEEIPVPDAWEGLMDEGQVQDTAYRDMDADIRGQIVESIVRTSKNLARAEVAIHKLSQGVTIEELREDGLVTDPVARAMLALTGAKE